MSHGRGDRNLYRIIWMALYLLLAESNWCSEPLVNFTNPFGAKRKWAGTEHLLKRCHSISPTKLHSTLQVNNAQLLQHLLFAICQKSSTNLLTNCFSTGLLAWQPSQQLTIWLSNRPTMPDKQYLPTWLSTSCQPESGKRQVITSIIFSVYGSFSCLVWSLLFNFFISSLRILFLKKLQGHQISKQ